MKLTKSNLMKKSMKIKILITDVDGVLTDGSRYYDEKKEIMKKFHVHDGMGVNILLRNNIKTLIITKEKSKIVQKWAREMNIHFVYEGIKNKESLVSKICKTFEVTSDEIAYIGDDVNDIELMKSIGLSACPQDAVNDTKKIANYTTKCSGGCGAFREFGDLILHFQFPKKKSWY